MKHLHWQYLVVLAPAIVSAVAGLLIVLAPWMASLHASAKAKVAGFFSSKEHVETLRDFLTSAAFIGPAVGVLFGINSESSTAYVLAAVTFVIASWLAFRLSTLFYDIQAAEASIGHRKMAGLVRSIVRSELEKERRYGVNEVSDRKRA